MPPDPHFPGTDPEFPQGMITTQPPAESELRDLRRIVTERLHGTVYIDQHTGRKTPIKLGPGKFKSTMAALCTCDYTDVLCDIPTNENTNAPDPKNMRLCLVCDAGAEMLGYPR